MDKQYKELTREEALTLQQAGVDVEMCWVRKAYSLKDDQLQWHKGVRLQVMRDTDSMFDDFFRVEVE